MSVLSGGVLLFAYFDFPGLKSTFLKATDSDGRSNMVTNPDTIIIARKNEPTVIYGTRFENSMGMNPIAITSTLRVMARPAPSNISWNDSLKSLFPFVNHPYSLDEVNSKVN